MPRHACPRWSTAPKPAHRIITQVTAGPTPWSFPPKNGARKTARKGTLAEFLLAIEIFASARRSTCELERSERGLDRSTTRRGIFKAADLDRCFSGHQCAVGGSAADKPSPKSSLGSAARHGRMQDRAFISVASIAELRRGIACSDAWPPARGTDRPAHSRSTINASPVCRTDPANRPRGRRALGVICHGPKPQKRHCIAVMDGFFAATALTNDLALVTRNVKDFAAFGRTITQSLGRRIKKSSAAAPQVQLRARRPALRSEHHRDPPHPSASPPSPRCRCCGRWWRGGRAVPDR